MSRTFAIAHIMSAPGAIEMETNFQKTVCTTIIRYKVIVFIIFLQLLLSCTSDFKMPRQDISDKLKFILCELRNIRVYLKENDNEIPMKGSFGYQLLSNNEMPEVILHNDIYIDPFLPGNNMVTVKHWQWPSEEMIPTEMTMTGEPMDYVKNKNGIIIVCFAGPDKTIDTENIEGIIMNEYNDGNWGNFQYHPEVIEYDPTNGAFSKGDIIFTLYQGELNNRINWYLSTNNPIYEKLRFMRAWDDGKWIFEK